MTLDEIRWDAYNTFIQRMDFYMNFGRGYQCFLESAITPGKAHLPRRLKKATKKQWIFNKTRIWKYNVLSIKRTLAAGVGIGTHLAAGARSSERPDTRYKAQDVLSLKNHLLHGAESIVINRK